jgi:hypothetical protein
MSTSVRQFIGLQNELFLQRKYHAFAETYAYPLVIHVGDQLTSYPSAAAFIPAVTRFRDILDRHGVRHILPEVEAIELPRKGRFRVWANWSYVRTDGSVHDTARCVHFLSTSDGQFRIEMSDYERLVRGADFVSDQKHRLA